MTDSLVWLAGVPIKDALLKLDPLRTHRDESWRWDVLTKNDATTGTLDGVSVGNLEYSIFNTIRGGGTLTWEGRNMPDWRQIRLQPWYILNTLQGEVAMPMGVFIPTTPKTEYGDSSKQASVSLYDKLLILDRDAVENTYTVPKGVNVVNKIREIILSAGEDSISIEPSDKVLANPQSFDPGDSKLKIINELLKSINYFSLSCDGYGAYRADPYTSTEQRPVAVEFVDDEASIYSPIFQHEADGFNVPNKVILLARTEGEEVPLRAVATNEDPLSEYSYMRTGTWIVVTEPDIEASSQTVLNALAQRRLAELSQVSSTFEISHALVPLDLNQIMRFVRVAEDLDVRTAVQKMSVSTEVGALVSTTLREVK